MTNIKEIKSDLLNEKYYEIDHASGLKIFVYPKENFNSSYAIFGTKYGSVDNKFKSEDKDEITKVPEGIAHFLEHKLFESEELDAFSRYAETGASANAYTTFDRTCYLFSCSGDIEPSLEILLDFVSNPYFTVETVEKEQGIIGQEIKMTNDEPGWASLFSLLKAVYHTHPVKIDIAGTVESIAEITPELLYECYNTFYNYHNMALAVVGNVTPKQVISVADKVLKDLPAKKVERIFDDEPETVVTDYTECIREVSMPIFAIGFKEKYDENADVIKTTLESQIMLEIIVGSTSDLYEKMIEKKYITSSIDSEYLLGPGYGLHIFSGESEHYDEIRKMLNNEIKRLKAEGVDREDFDRIKRAIIGHVIMTYNSTNLIANELILSHFYGYNIFDELSAIEKITVEDIDKRIRDTLVETNSSMSVVKAK